MRTAQPPAVARSGDILAAPEPGGCPLENSNVRLTLKAVEFRDAPDLPPDTLAAAYQGLIGREIPVSAICQIRDRATTILFRRGLLARVEIPEQTIMQGRLSLDVIAAYVAAIQVQGDAGPAQKKVEDYIERLRGLRPFDINAAQRYLLLASDIPGVVISASLRSSSQGRGAVELDIQVGHVPFGAVLASNNFGAKTAGRMGALMRADFNSLTPFGERTSLIAYSTFDGNWREQQAIQGVEEARIGSDGLVAKLSFAYASTHPGDILGPLNITGKSIVGDFRLAYPIIRSRSLNVSATAGATYVRQDIDVSTIPFTRDRLSLFIARLSADKAWSDVPVTLGGGIELHKGVGSALAGSSACSPASPCLLSRFEARPDAFVQRADGRIAVQWLPLVSTVATFQAQHSDVPLLAYEEFAIGNLTVGRGYDPSVLSGDSGIGGAAELQIGPFNPGGIAFFAPGLTFIGFFDIARVWNKDTGGVVRSLRSTGAGINLQIVQHVQIQLLYSKPLDNVSGLLASKPSSRFLFNMTVGF
ncbi:MAG TPA: ShlB/FhaC/HecB family hemolysin secretion/activation protein [Micropepsaceae bacterium]